VSYDDWDGKKKLSPVLNAYIFWLWRSDIGCNLISVELLVDQFSIPPLERNLTSPHYYGRLLSLLQEIALHEYIYLPHNESDNLEFGVSLTEPTVGKHHGTTQELTLPNPIFRSTPHRR
jgi:hypothetical protein